MFKNSSKAILVTILQNLCPSGPVIREPDFPRIAVLSKRCKTKDAKQNLGLKKTTH